MMQFATICPSATLAIMILRRCDNNSCNDWLRTQQEMQQESTLQAMDDLGWFLHQSQEQLRATVVHATDRHRKNRDNNGSYPFLPVRSRSPLRCRLSQLLLLVVAVIAAATNISSVVAVCNNSIVVRFK